MWDPALIISITLLLMITAIVIIAIFRYPKVEDVLKIWSMLGAFAGIVTGSMATYFFQNTRIEEKDRERLELQTRVE